MSTALITGATVNTGLGIALKFAREGWDVVITSRREDALPAAMDRIRAVNPSIRVQGFPLQPVLPDNRINEQAMDALFTSLDGQGTAVDCLVLNAANLGIGQQVFHTPVDDFINVIQTNIVANYCLIERAALRMKDRAGGSVVLINSNTAYRAIPDRVAYSASKAGQLGMMRALALDLGKYNIRVNAVLPGMIKTDRWQRNLNHCQEAPSNRTPLGDIAEFADIADAVWYFAACARNTTGAELTVDGGNMIQLYPLES